MNVKSCMKRNVVSIPATTTIRDAATIIVRKHIGLLPVVDKDDKPVGVIMAMIPVILSSLIFFESLVLIFSEKVNRSIVALAGSVLTIAAGRRLVFIRKMPPSKRLISIRWDSCWE